MYRGPVGSVGEFILQMYRFCSTFEVPDQPDQTNQRWPSKVKRAPSMAHLSSGRSSFWASE